MQKTKENDKLAEVICLACFKIKKYNADPVCCLRCAKSQTEKGKQNGKSKAS